MSPGNTFEVGGKTIVDYASMRPGLMSPGNESGNRRAAAAEPASMRPGLMSPGNETYVATDTQRILLQ